LLPFGTFSVDDFRPLPDSAPRLVRRIEPALRRVSLQLLRTSVPASTRESAVFEFLVNYLRLGSGVCRTTHRGRLAAVDAVSNELLRGRYGDRPLDVHDWAASDALTTVEWAASLFLLFPRASLTASDLMLTLVEATLSDAAAFILEPDGHPLQYIRRPFVIRLEPPEPWWLFLNRRMGKKAKARFDALHLEIPSAWIEADDESFSAPQATLRKISLIHPDARLLLASEPRFSICRHSVFAPLERAVDVIRTMNIFNRGYFPAERLQEGIRTVFESLKPDGCWIVGRTKEERQNVTILERTDSGFRPLVRIGDGSEIEDLALTLDG
jgi:hypothetical protein